MIAYLRRVQHPSWGRQIGIVMPYCEPFIAALKARLRSRYRKWDPRLHAWFVWEPKERTLLEVLDAHAIRHEWTGRILRGLKEAGPSCHRWWA